MKLRRVPEQAHETLEDTYRALGSDSGPHWAASSKMMLELIQLLSADPSTDECLVSTSHHYLLFHEKDNPALAKVVVSAWADKYKIEYEMPSTIAPWPDAHVVGYTASATEALKMIAIARVRSSQVVGG